MNKKIIVLTAVMCACLLSACQAPQSTDSTGSTPAESQEAVTSSQESSQEQSSAALTEYSQADFDTAIKSCYNFGLDTAGGSLKAASAAANVVEFSAKYVTAQNTDKVEQDIETWYNSLTEDEKADFSTCWDTIYSNAKTIVTDLPSAEAMLSDAGVTTDFKTMDLTNGSLFAEAINSFVDSLNK